MTTSQPPAVGTQPVVILSPNPLNPRGAVDGPGLDELAASIRAQGVLQPLLITPDGVVVAGHRRLAAARIAGLDEVRVVVRDLDPVQQQEIMLVENLQRQDLSAIELSGIASGTTNRRCCLANAHRLSLFAVPGTRS
jgi:ParB family chromosome partitioning protein